MFLFSLGQTDAWFAGESASDANGDLQKFIAAKQWKKVKEDISKLRMPMSANKRDAERPKELQKKRKKLTSKKWYHTICIKFHKKVLWWSNLKKKSFKLPSCLFCAYLILWLHSWTIKSFISSIKVLKKYFGLKSPKKVVKYD